MPTYDFLNTDTGEIFERVMSISAKEQFLQENPHIQTHIGKAPAMGDSVRLRIRKPDNGFKEVLQKVHEKTAGSQLNRTADI